MLQSYVNGQARVERLTTTFCCVMYIIVHALAYCGAPLTSSHRSKLGATPAGSSQTRSGSAMMRLSRPLVRKPLLPSYGYSESKKMRSMNGWMDGNLCAVHANSKTPQPSSPVSSPAIHSRTNTTPPHPPLSPST